MKNIEERLTYLEKLLFETDQYRNSGGELPYKVYTALLNQSGEDAPTAIVLENTIGTITFAYVDVGIYQINCSNCFTENKTFILPRGGFSGGFDEGQLYSTQRISSSQYYLYTYGPSLDLYNGYLNDTAIEIRVYP